MAEDTLNAAAKAMNALAHALGRGDENFFSKLNFIMVIEPKIL